MSRCVALVTDLIFAARLRGTGEKLGKPCRIVGAVPALEAALADGPPAVAIVDMNAEGVSGADAIRLIRAQCPGARVVAFLSHVQRDLAEAARQAGADEVLPRSRFVERLPELLG